MSVRQIGEELGLSFAAVQYWLAKYELKTEPHHYSRRDAEKTPSILRECSTHGWTVFVRSGAQRLLPLSRSARSGGSRHTGDGSRRSSSRRLAADASLCGYDIYAGALQFHHRRPGAQSASL